LLEGNIEGWVEGNEVGPELGAVETLGIPLGKLEGSVYGSDVGLSEGSVPKLWLGVFDGKWTGIYVGLDSSDREADDITIKGLADGRLDDVDETPSYQ
jgi:hypothetical protein